jgi:L-amino acid N-acyltransferase YncA
LLLLNGSLPSTPTRPYSKLTILRLDYQIILSTVKRDSDHKAIIGHNLKRSNLAEVGEREKGWMQTRRARVEDAAAMIAIYNQGIEDRVATFETRPRTIEDVRTWFDGSHPLVVVENAEQIIAFASTSTYRPRECYAGIAEFSVYVARDARGRGAGRVAMQVLIEAAREAGLWKLVSRIFIENSASRALMLSLGFREVGIYEKHGKLDGVWRDVVIVERLISENL